MVAPAVKSASGSSLDSRGRVCVGVFDKNLASLAVKTFSHLI
jgi:hypothetical protein